MTEFASHEELEPAAGRVRARWLLALLPGLGLLAALLGAIRSPALYHGDERFYTDAALTMQQTGNYAVPSYADGAPRLNKPLLTYWLIAASQQLLGPGLFQARLPFAVAGALLVLLTACLARRVFADEQVGALAALLMASQPDLLTLGARSTPDIWVCLGVMLALDGATRLFLGEAARRSGACEFWLGFGLCTAAKGLWGALIAGFVFLWAARAPERRARLRCLWEPRTLLPGCALAALGVVPLFAAGSGAVLESGATDQLRAAPTVAVFLHNLAEYLPAPLIHLLPWSAGLALVLLPGVRPHAARLLRHPFARVALGWFALLLLVFLFGAQRRTRYLAPAHGPLAVLLAAWLVTLARGTRAGITLRRASFLLCTLLAALLWVTLLFLPGLPAAERVGLAFLCGASSLLALRAWRGTAVAALACAGWSALALALAFVGLLRPALSHAPFSAILSCLEGRDATRGALGIAGVDESIGARLRLLSGGLLEPVPIDESVLAAGQAPALVLAGAEVLPAWLARGYVARAEFDPPGGPTAREVLSSVRSGRPVPRGPAERRLTLLESPPSLHPKTP